jgi:uncharacterized damage-inducible protein DinB
MPVETQHKLKDKPMKSSNLPVNEFAPNFNKYISILGDVHLTEELEISVHEFIKFVQNIPMDKFDYRYEEGKWTIKDIIQHLIDAERIFAYRALRIARNDKTPLPGFEENDYAVDAQANSRTIQDLLTEMAVVRQSTLSLFKSLPTQSLERIGTMSNKQMSVRAIGFLIIGHQKHHQKIFQERYLNL